MSKSRNAENFESTNGELSPLKKIERLLLVGFLALGLSGVTTGCGGEKAEKSPKSNKRVETTVPTAEEARAEQIKKSASETRYAEYFEDLSPPQQAVRESLEPDKLLLTPDGQIKTEAQIKEAYTIRKQEITDENGMIVPAKLAEAYTARRQGMAITWLPDKIYDQWGGLDNFQYVAASDYFFRIGSEALWGKDGEGNGSKLVLTRGSAVDGAIKDKHKSNIDHLRIRETVISGSTKSTGNYTNENLTVEFEMYMSDNYPTEFMYAYDGVRIEPNSGSKTLCTITGIHINDDNTVSLGHCEEVLVSK